MKTANVILATVEADLPDGQTVGDFQATLTCTTPETAFTQQVQHSAISTGITFPDLPPGAYSLSVTQLDTNNFPMHTAETTFEVPVQARYEALTGVTVTLT